MNRPPLPHPFKGGKWPERDGKTGGTPGTNYKPGNIDQRQVMWVRAQKDPKTGKVIRKGYLAYRNDHTRSRVTDPKTGKPRKARRGDRFTGTVRVAQPGSTYMSEQRYSQRGGGEHSKTHKTRAFNLARYVGGRNVNNPKLREKLKQDHVSAARREATPKASKGK